MDKGKDNKEPPKESKENKDASKEASAKDKKPEAEKTVQLLKKGDYSVHILAEEVRNLVAKDNS